MKTCNTLRHFGADGSSGGNAVSVGRLGRFSAAVRSVTLVAILLGGVGFAQTLSASDRWETLQAINMVENPNNSTRVGRNGELGPYQFRPSTWRMHTKKPFRLATDRTEADAVAIKHYEWIKRQLERNGLEATPYRVALAWNAGLSATLRNSVPTSSHTYASRVEALTEDMKQRQLVSKK